MTDGDRDRNGGRADRDEPGGAAVTGMIALVALGLILLASAFAHEYAL